MLTVLPLGQTQSYIHVVSPDSFPMGLGRRPPPPHGDTCIHEAYCGTLHCAGDFKAKEEIISVQRIGTL